ncbi:TetR/AcrR family transcriptional regulator [Nocardia sp. BMG51109]|uniref:TetR/AcrR family transcriptional regulator n=1 Tax=Nocardia sp. BMG51109 TaxID=1056816 RepID=UPI0006886D96|nr:TetR/AcrR family transcriptional regulator [Nocardia sp. BMG51109]
MAAASKTSLSRVDATDDIETRILDGALIRFQKVGVKKTTVEDIAREAGVDRVTVYRRMGSRDDLVQAVVNREVGAVLEEISAIPERHDALADLVADMFVTVITRWRTNPLVERMLSVEPERVVMKLTADGGTTFAMSVTATAAALDRAVARGLLEPAPDMLTRAEIVCRVVHSMVLAPEGAVRLHTEAELSDFARTYLTPIVAG